MFDRGSNKNNCLVQSWEGFFRTSLCMIFIIYTFLLSLFLKRMVRVRVCKEAAAASVSS